MKIKDLIRQRTANEESQLSPISGLNNRGEFATDDKKSVDSRKMAIKELDKVAKK